MTDCKEDEGEEEVLLRRKRLTKGSIGGEGLEMINTNSLVHFRFLPGGCCDRNNSISATINTTFVFIIINHELSKRIGSKLTLTWLFIEI